MNERNAYYPRTSHERYARGFIVPAARAAYDFATRNPRFVKGVHHVARNINRAYNYVKPAINNPLYRTAAAGAYKAMKIKKRFVFLK